LIREITDSKLVKKGFNQVYFITDNYEILLNDIKKGTGFDGHSHPHHQFVYCFQGRFDLTVKGIRHPVKRGDSLLINAGAEHSVDAAADFKSMDVKYLSGGKETVDLRLNVLEEKVNNDDLLLETAQLNGMKLRKIMNKKNTALINISAKKTCDYFFIAPGETRIKIDGVGFEFQPMTIYQMAGREEFSLLLMSSGYLLVLEI
jgi:quercetin dioxygenase-like cupin family protein